VHEELESERGTYMAKCKDLRADIKNIVKEAKDEGVNTKALKGVVEARRLQGKIDDIPTDFDLDESAQYDILAQAFGGTEFGDHCADLARESGSSRSDAVDSLTH
jgi:uncharacterized protein (UPF0335 family)